MPAESVVSFLLTRLNSLLVEGAKLLKGVSNEVRQIKDELERMRAFLRDADARAESDTRVKTWVAQVREAAYDIDDVLDEYCLHLAQEHHGHKVKIFLSKTIHFIKQVKMRHQISNQLQELRTRVIDISSGKANYDFKMIDQGSSSSIAPSDRASHLRSTARFVEEADLVGIDNPRNELIGLLVGGESRLRTISVVGMGGLGKTTLVGKVYEMVKTHFEFSAWVTVSQTFSIEEIFRSMIGGADAMGKDKLIEKLRSHLQQKRYVIVIDDLWKVDDWECIKIGLPNGEHGSRIIVTARINEVAAACARTSDRVYNLKPLPFEQGWVLFCRKAFQSDLGGNFPPDLKPLSQKFVRKCGGLPLAIAAIGSLLSTKTKTSVEWQKLYDRLGHQIESSNNLTIMNQILLLSYDDLPYYLKPCFMYVSIFPEDYLIKPMRLIRLWIAEGFVERKEGMTLEEVADDYLHELINRSLIQVASYTDYGTFKACCVHDVVREIVLSKAREEKFTAFLIGTNPSDKTRRLGMDYNRGIVPKKNLSHVRTVVMFQGERLPDSLMKDFSGFRLLKVLDLERTCIEKFPSKIVNLLHLRLMSLRNTSIRTLPESIGKLKNLEMLDLHSTQIQELPTSIVKLQNLCILIARPCSTTRMGGIKMTDGVGSLRSLQQLGYIKADQGNGDVIRELGKLTQLKWLGISELKSEDGLGLCTSIEKMTCLSSLSVSSVKTGIASRHGLLDLKYLSAPSPLLGHVDLIGRLEELPHWIPSLSNLICLRLEYSRLEEDPFSALKHLSNLIQLKLDGAYDGKELCCKGGGFQRLNSLTLCRLERLKLARLEKGAMPSLQKLSIRSCMSLMTVPFGIEHLTHLKVIEFVNLRTEFWKNIKKGKGADRWKISHVPDVKVDMSTGLDEDWRGLFEDR